MLASLIAQYRKAAAAFAGASVTVIAGVGVNWLVTGQFDVTQLRLGIAAAIGATFLSAKAKPNAPVAVGLGSDDLLAEATDPALGGHEQAPPLDPDSGVPR